MDCLVIIYPSSNALLGKQFVLDQSPLRVGRSADNHIVLDADSVSRRHARWERRGEVWWIVDDSSTCGTYVNDEQIPGERALQNGDRIKIGGIIFKYLHGEDAESQGEQEIHNIVVLDGLTRIYNKRYLGEASEREVSRARRYTRELSVAMFDIDHFKRINDQLGHLAGDYVLKELAQVVRARTRRDQIFARYGGEEFALVLPETSLASARALCESLRESVAQHPFTFEGTTLSITISIGLACLNDKDRAAHDLFERASEALGRAKRLGRNRTEQEDPGGPRGQSGGPR